MADGAEGTMRLLWEERAGPRRGPKPTLSLEGIAAAAIEIADAEGLTAVSMQRVATALGFTKMSLYRYVPGKTELVALMVESAIGPPPGTGAGDWRTCLDAWAHALLARMTAHPWTLEATVGPRVPGPYELSWMEMALAALDGCRLNGAERMDAVVLITGHVRGIAQQAAATAPGQSTEGQLTGVLAALMREHGDRFPAIAAALATSPQDGGDDAFTFGLARILDGLAALIATRN